MPRGREESEYRPGEGVVAALAFICSSAEGLILVCTHLKGHPTAGGPGMLWVTPRGRENQNPRGQAGGGGCVCRNRQPWRQHTPAPGEDQQLLGSHLAGEPLGSLRVNDSINNSTLD